MGPHVRDDALLLLAHGAEELLARGAAGELEGVGHQGALLRHGPDVARQHVVGPEPVADLLAGQPLGHRDGVEDLPAGDQRVDDVAQAGASLEQVLARLDLAAVPLGVERGGHQRGAVDHALALELAHDVADVRAGRDDDNLVGRERAGRLDALDAERHQDHQRHGRDAEEGQDAAQRRHDRAGFARTRGRGRHGAGLQGLAGRHHRAPRFQGGAVPIRRRGRAIAGIGTFGHVLARHRCAAAARTRCRQRRHPTPSGHGAPRPAASAPRKLAAKG